MRFFFLESLALKWSLFFLGSGLVVFNEYSALFMQQLGLSLAQISCTSLMGVLHLTLLSVRISRRQISCEETHFNRTASGLLHNHPGSSLPTCLLVADVLSKTG